MLTTFAQLVIFNLVNIYHRCLDTWWLYPAKIFFSRDVVLCSCLFYHHTSYFPDQCLFIPTGFVLCTDYCWPVHRYRIIYTSCGLYLTFCYLMCLTRPMISTRGLTHQTSRRVSHWLPGYTVYSDLSYWEELRWANQSLSSLWLELRMI